MRTVPLLVLSLLLLVFTVVFTGCSRNYALSGKVTFSDDGSPVTDGVVIFTTDTHIAQGIIKKNGMYTVGSEKLTDGIPPGNYKIYIGGAEKVSTTRLPNGEEKNSYQSLIDDKYRSSDSSGLMFKADGSTRTFDIKLERAKK